MTASTGQTIASLATSTEIRTRPNMPGRSLPPELSTAITTAWVRVCGSIFIRTWSISPRNVSPGSAAKLGLDLLALGQQSDVGLQHLADDPHRRRIDHVVEVVGGAHRLPDADVGVRDDAADRADDRDIRERLALLFDPPQGCLIKAKREEFLPGDLQRGRLFRELGLRFQERFAGDDSLLVERGSLLDQLAGQLDLRPWPATSPSWSDSSSVLTTRASSCPGATVSPGRTSTWSILPGTSEVIIACACHGSSTRALTVTVRWMSPNSILAVVRPIASRALSESMIVSPAMVTPLVGSGAWFSCAIASSKRANGRPGQHGRDGEQADHRKEVLPKHRKVSLRVVRVDRD